MSQETRKVLEMLAPAKLRPRTRKSFKNSEPRPLSPTRRPRRPRVRAQARRREGIAFGSCVSSWISPIATR